MPSIAIPTSTLAITGATALGVISVASTTSLFPGALGWISKDDASAYARIKIIAILSATTVQVRKFANNDTNSPPSYGFSDLSAFAAGSHISQEVGTVTVDPSFTLQIVP